MLLPLKVIIVSPVLGYDMRETKMEEEEGGLRKGRASYISLIINNK